MFNFKKNKKKKKKKDRFGLIFALLSILAFFLFLFILAWVKNTLYEVKDQVSMEFISEYESEKIQKSFDPLISSKASSTYLEEPIDSEEDPSLGPKDASVKIFYFSDFSCSFCLEQLVIFEDVYDEFKQDMRIIWKDYPDLSSLDSFSYQAARAARCAQEQEAFWEYKKLLEGPYKSFSSLAEDIDLDSEKFSKCLSSSKVDELILNNVNEAESLNIAGVPYTYINGKEFLGSLSEDELRDIIEIELDK
jgi:protein-disulfide isomerase